MFNDLSLTVNITVRPMREVAIRARLSNSADINYFIQESSFNFITPSIKISGPSKVWCGLFWDSTAHEEILPILKIPARGYIDSDELPLSSMCDFKNAALGTYTVRNMITIPISRDENWHDQDHEFISLTGETSFELS